VFVVSKNVWRLAGDSLNISSMYGGGERCVQGFGGET
jgi:hypothetical protein